MRHVRLGRTGPEVSRICLGCMGFGDPNNGQHTWTLTEDRSREVIRTALDQGIDFFDTAAGYQNGTSEAYLGRALRDLADRDSVVVATKFLPRSQAEVDAGIGGREHVVRSLDASLSHLGTDHVDLLIYHMWDYRTPLSEIMQGLKDAMESGKALHIGISNCFAWQVCRTNALADAMDMERFISVQNHYNLIFREEEREMCQYCRDAGVAMTSYSPLASGRLARPLGADTRRMTEDAYAHLKYDATEATDREIVDRVAKVAADHGVSMTQVSLAWLLSKVAAPVVGATSPAQVIDIAQSPELVLSKDEVGWLEEPYVPHRLVGVMAQNTAEAADRKHVWTRRGDRNGTCDVLQRTG